MSLRHGLVIATRNRADDLREALASVLEGQRLPDEVVVIDSSDGEESRELLTELIEAHPEVQWHYEHSSPGLPRQRNIGVARATSDVLHFIDDDVVLEQGYLAALDDLFETPGNEDVLGGGGLITNLGDPTPRLWWRLGLLDSHRQGAVLASGQNIMVHDVDGETEVQWLSGCSMSYRRSVFDRDLFDEELAGYALMEDLDFSVRVRRHGRLVVSPRARLIHKVSPEGRWSLERRHRAWVYRRYWFVQKNLPWWQLPAFAWSVLAGVLVEAVIGLATLRRYRLRVAMWRVRGTVDLIRGLR